MKNKDSCAIMFFYSSYETTFTKVVQNIFEVNLQSSQFKKSPHFFSSSYVLTTCFGKRVEGLVKNLVKWKSFHDDSSYQRTLPLF